MRPVDSLSVCGTVIQALEASIWQLFLLVHLARIQVNSECFFNMLVARLVADLNSQYHLVHYVRVDFPYSW